MKWSFLIARVAGTEVRIHVTFVLLLAFVAWKGGMVGALFIATIFFCVLLHEFGHALAARRYGIHTPDITLLPIGGVARLERMPRTPMHELVVAAAGPAVNVVIAAILLVVLRGTPSLPGLEAISDGRNFLALVLVANLWLIAFNMVPAFPMDGGRVLRALLAMKLPHARATRIAATVGQALALAGGFFALVNGHWILLAIAIFIFIAAEQEASAARFEDTTHGLPVQAAMISRFDTLSPLDSLQTAVDKLLAGSQHDFPITDGGGNLRGLLTRADLIAALAKFGPGHPVFDVATREPATITSDYSLTDALIHMSQAEPPVLVVLDPDTNAVVGILNNDNLAETVMVARAIRSRGQTQPPRIPPQPPPLPPGDTRD